MIELRGPRIFAVPYTKRRPLKPVRMLDGSIVEDLTPEQRLHAPEALPAFFEIVDEDLFLGLLGLYLLPNGRTAAVYGGKGDSIDPPRNECSANLAD